MKRFDGLARIDLARDFQQTMHIVSHALPDRGATMINRSQPATPMRAVARSSTLPRQSGGLPVEIVLSALPHVGVGTRCPFSSRRPIGRTSTRSRRCSAGSTRTPITRSFKAIFAGIEIIKLVGVVRPVWMVHSYYAWTA
jgi:hypothetical protein